MTELAEPMSFDEIRDLFVKSFSDYLQRKMKERVIISSRTIEELNRELNTQLEKNRDTILARSVNYTEPRKEIENTAILLVEETLKRARPRGLLLARRQLRLEHLQDAIREVQAGCSWPTH